ncbi:DUF3786 domain-containing protein [Chloroflexota bacterium]
MQSKQSTLPEKSEYGYELAYKLAGKRLTEINDIEQQCHKSDSRYLAPRKAIIIGHLNQSYLITLPDIKISLEGKEEEVPLRDKILLLHYFTRAKGTPISNKLISFKELPEGINYYPTFYQRTVKPMVSNFGSEPHRLLETAKSLNGHATDFGDAAVTIDAFNRVPITLVLWKGDDEFTPEGTVMFDSTIADYLPTEDIIVLCETIVRRLVKAAKE